MINVYGVYWANWTAVENPKPSGEDYYLPGHILTATEDLRQGTYRFTVEGSSPDTVDCGQEIEPTEYVVVVTEPGGPTQLPPPPSLTFKERTEDYIAFDVAPVSGATKYLLSGEYRAKPYELFEPGK